LEMAKSGLRQAAVRIEYAGDALAKGEYPYIIRQSQEAVKLDSKGILRLVGIEPPKWHDVGPVLKDNTHRFPQWFAESIEELSSISRELRREREPSMYGDEETSTPPHKLYSRSDAEKDLSNARKVLDMCEKLLAEWIVERQNS
jgi:HEPN domain-containing protein